MIKNNTTLPRCWPRGMRASLYTLRSAITLKRQTVIYARAIYTAVKELGHSHAASHSHVFYRFISALRRPSVRNAGGNRKQRNASGRRNTGIALAFSPRAINSVSCSCYSIQSNSLFFHYIRILAICEILNSTLVRSIFLLSIQKGEFIKIIHKIHH